jgi:hypothetical protein
VSESPSRKPSPPGLRLIRLLRGDDGRLVVAPPQAEAARAGPLRFAPFPLPPLPLSLHSWATALGAEFHRRHQRCLAALLMLDCQTRRWVRPLVPAQACGRDGACWTLDLGDTAVPPARQRVAGSFQTRAACDLFDAAATVPRLDGLHIVQAGGGANWTVYAFLHNEGETSVVPPDDMLVDDWDQALLDAADRLNFD